MNYLFPNYIFHHLRCQDAGVRGNFSFPFSSHFFHNLVGKLKKSVSFSFLSWKPFLLFDLLQLMFVCMYVALYLSKTRLVKSYVFASLSDLYFFFFLHFTASISQTICVMEVAWQLKRKLHFYTMYIIQITECYLSFIIFFIFIRMTQSKSLNKIIFNTLLI